MRRAIGELEAERERARDRQVAAEAAFLAVVAKLRLVHGIPDGTPMHFDEDPETRRICVRAEDVPEPEEEGEA